MKDHKESKKEMAKAIKMSPVIQAQLTTLFVGCAMWQQVQPQTSFVRVWSS